MLWYCIVCNQTLCISYVINSCPKGHGFGYRLSQLVYSMVGGLAFLGELNSYSLNASQALFGTYPLRAHVPFFQISCYSLALFLVCFFLLLHPYCSHARGILCGINTSSMGSPFPIVHAEWCLVFQSFRIMLCCVEKDCFKQTKIMILIIYRNNFAIVLILLLNYCVVNKNVCRAAHLPAIHCKCLPNDQLQIQQLIVDQVQSNNTFNSQSEIQPPKDK